MFSSPAPRLLKLCRKALLPASMMVAVLLFGTPASATAISYTYDAASRVAKVVYEDGISKSIVFDREGNIASSTTQATSVLLPGMMALLLPGQGQASPQEQGLQSSLLQ
ncbi:hypothetical protein [Fundidesulfovibrio agrisoli]|uniref:hypothetical protein n=1 Tax=Fundidesulfovibrio agrisoli TaxID=2922717 RepID=UPI001FACD605|nr:hypothetical protein [Fundidesulfovibrio agrisoli]